LTPGRKRHFSTSLSIINVTWWFNRKDERGGSPKFGFLGVKGGGFATTSAVPNRGKKEKTIYQSDCKKRASLMNGRKELAARKNYATFAIKFFKRGGQTLAKSHDRYFFT